MDAKDLNSDPYINVKQFKLVKPSSQSPQYFLFLFGILTLRWEQTWGQITQRSYQQAAGMKTGTKTEEELD